MAFAKTKAPAPAKRVRAQTTKYVHVDNDVLEVIGKLAKTDDRSESYMINKLLREAVEARRSR